MSQGTIGVDRNRAGGYPCGQSRISAGRLFRTATVLKALRPMTKGELTWLEAGNDD
jgi:hypothetical protein